MNIRFAGLEDFMNNDQYNQGDVAMAAGAIDTALKNYSTLLEGGIASEALGYKAENEAKGILDSAGSYAKNKGNLANWINLGSSLVRPIAGAFGSASASMPTTSGFTDVPNTGGGFYYAPDGSIQVNPV